ncbi:MAG: hypothetical protein PUI22_01740 [Bacteroidales bacterium]|nr:hypothetical protein [Bacteroidales bacterium]MDY5262648.1 hypothetical protein [Candidatus Cryptobacteroides sp.]
MRGHPGKGKESSHGTYSGSGNPGRQIRRCSHELGIAEDLENEIRKLSESIDLE